MFWHFHCQKSLEIVWIMFCCINILPEDKRKTKNSNKAIFGPPPVLRVKFDPRVLHPRIPEKSAFHNQMEKWPRIKTDLESGLLVHQHSAQHSLFSPPHHLQVQPRSGEILQFLPIIVWLGYENPQSQRLLLIPLSKLRNASIGIHNQPPKKHCMLVCYKFCMFATHNKSFKEICKNPFLESLSLQLGMSSGTWVRSHAGEQSQYGSYQLPVLHNSLLYDPKPPSTSRY